MAKNDNPYKHLTKPSKDESLELEAESVAKDPYAVRLHKRLEKMRDTSAGFSWAVYGGVVLLQVVTHLAGALPLLKDIGKQYFTPLMYALDGFSAVFDLGVLFYKKTKKSLTGQALEHDKRYRSARAIGNVLIIAVDTLIILSAVGVLSTGVGAIAVASFMAVGWAKDSVLEWWKAKKDYQRAKENYTANLEKGIDDIHEKYALQEKRAKVTEKRNTMILGVLAVVGMALLAGGPFGLGAMAMAGAAVFGIYIIAVTARAINNKITANRTAGYHQLIEEKTEETEQVSLLPSPSIEKELIAGPTISRSPKILTSSSQSKKQDSPITTPRVGDRRSPLQSSISVPSTIFTSSSLSRKRKQDSPITVPDYAPEPPAKKLKK